MRKSLNIRIAGLTLAVVLPGALVGVAFGSTESSDAVVDSTVAKSTTTSSAGSSTTEGETWIADGIRPDSYDNSTTSSAATSTTVPSVTATSLTAPTTVKPPSTTVKPPATTVKPPATTVNPPPTTIAGAGSPKLTPSNVISKIGPYDQGQGWFTSWVLDAADHTAVFDQMYGQMVAQGWVERQATSESADFNKGPSAVYIETAMRPDGKVNLMMVYYPW